MDGQGFWIISVLDIESKVNPYENIILISHEDTSKDITKKGGDKITAIKPNMQDKVALKVAGMVDIVARIVADGDDRTFNFKSNEVIFGGGRLKTDAKDIPLDVNELFRVYDEANRNAVRKAQTAVSEPVKEQVAPDAEQPSDGKETVRTSRRRKVAEPVEDVGDDSPSAATWEPGGGASVEEPIPVESEKEPVQEEKPRVRKSRRTTTNE
ncbi:MAG: hypothetical protein DBX36_00195 [Oscillospiraceae bacterium]|nr:MAG: hypothetical protein DBX36_00195 [Oscillospiraceae bacterium]